MNDVGALVRPQLCECGNSQDNTFREKRTWRAKYFGLGFIGPVHGGFLMAQPKLTVKSLADSSLNSAQSTYPAERPQGLARR